MELMTTCTGGLGPCVTMTHTQVELNVVRSLFQMEL